MTDKFNKSIVNSKNKVRKKEINTTKVSKTKGCITEFKNSAILKFCKEDHTKSDQYEEMFNSNVLNKIGMY